MLNAKLKPGDKQVISSPKGGKAVLIYRGANKRCQMFLYEPSRAYLDRRNSILNPIKPKRKSPNTVSMHKYIVETKLGRFFNSLINPNANDNWLGTQEDIREMIGAATPADFLKTIPCPTT